MGNILHRKLEQIYTPGIQNIHCLQNDAGDPSIHPWLGLCEGENGLLAACIVDMDRMSLGVTQWQEVDEMRSTLATIMSHTNPIEIVIPFPSHLSKDTQKCLKNFRPLIMDGLEKKLSISYLRLSTEQVASFSMCSSTDEKKQSVLRALGSITKINQDFVQSLSHMENKHLAMFSLWVSLVHMKSAKVNQGYCRNFKLNVLPPFTADGSLACGNMFLDAVAMKSLEILNDSLGGTQGSLLGLLSSGTSTNAGKRCIARWLSAPLFKEKDILERLDTIECISYNMEAAQNLQKKVQALPDLGRLLPTASHSISQILADKDAGELPRSEATGAMGSIVLKTFAKDIKNFATLLENLNRWGMTCIMLIKVDQRLEF